MKIKIRKNKRSITVEFKAERGEDNEGVDLKEAVLGAVQGGSFSPAEVINKLGEKGYVVEQPVRTTGCFSAKRKRGDV